jgi:molybdate transport system substrate-binding protein
MVAVLCLALAGCAAGPPSAPPRTLMVFAAASLTEAFTALGKRFELDHPGVTVRFNYAGSSDLAQQIVNGAPADVFASANEATMKTVTDAGFAAGRPTVFATNTLQIATAPGNPKHIDEFADLARPGLSVVVAAPQVPCGAATRQVERITGVTVRPVSEESDVKAALSKVVSGDADAVVVYVTDVAAAGRAVQGVNFAEASMAVSHYPMTVLKNASQAGLAARFEDSVTGDVGEKALRAAGFGTPSG